MCRLVGDRVQFFKPIIICLQKAEAAAAAVNRGNEQTISIRSAHPSSGVPWPSEIEISKWILFV